MKIQTQININWNEAQKHKDDIHMIIDLIIGCDKKETSNTFTAGQRKMRQILPKFLMHNEILYYRENVEDVSGSHKKVAKTDSSGIPRKLTFLNDQDSQHIEKKVILATPKKNC